MLELNEIETDDDETVARVLVDARSGLAGRVARLADASRRILSRQK